jgi:uncharacterized protein
MKYAWLGIAGVIAAAGCASTPVNFYTLSPSTPDAAHLPRDALAVQLPAARVPAQVNRKEIVIRESSDRLALMENEHWASSLGDEISGAVLLQFTAELDKSDPRIWQQISALELSIDVHQLDAVMDRRDLFSATWNAKIHLGDAIVTLSCPFSASRPIATGVSAVVVGYQQEIAELGVAMALGMANSVSQHRIESR